MRRGLDISLTGSHVPVSGNLHEYVDVSMDFSQPGQAGKSERVTTSHRFDPGAPCNVKHPRPDTLRFEPAPLVVNKDESCQVTALPADLLQNFSRVSVERHNSGVSTLRRPALFGSDVDTSRFNILPGQVAEFSYSEPGEDEETEDSGHSSPARILQARSVAHRLKFLLQRGSFKSQPFLSGKSFARFRLSRLERFDPGAGVCPDRSPDTQPRQPGSCVDQFGTDTAQRRGNAPMPRRGLFQAPDLEILQVIGFDLSHALKSNALSEAGETSETFLNSDYAASPNMERFIFQKRPDRIRDAWRWPKSKQGIPLEWPGAKSGSVKVSARNIDSAGPVVKSSDRHGGGRLLRSSLIPRGLGRVSRHISGVSALRFKMIGDVIYVTKILEANGPKRKIVGQLLSCRVRDCHDVTESVVRLIRGIAAARARLPLAQRNNRVASHLINGPLKPYSKVDKATNVSLNGSSRHAQLTGDCEGAGWSARDHAMQDFHHSSALLSILHDSVPFELVNALLTTRRETVPNQSSIVKSGDTKPVRAIPVSRHCGSGSV